MKNNIGYKRLKNIPTVIMTKKDLTEESLDKVKDTARYSLSLDPNQDKKEVIERCLIAQMAEQHVAHYMEGFINHGIENTDDPLSYAYDVLANIKYTGLRIEVKTHQSESKWITVSTGHAEPYKGHAGINLRPFIECGVADLMIIFRTTKVSPGEYKLSPMMMCDRTALIPKSGVVKSSQFTGFYMQNYVSAEIANQYNIHYFDLL